MSQHFKAVGFDVANPERLQQLAHQAIQYGQPVSTRRAGLPEAAFLWDIGRGLQIWVYASRSGGDDYEIISCLPGFLGEEKLRFRAYRIARNPRQTGEVLMRALLPGGAEMEFILINLALFDGLSSSGLDLDVHLSGLAVEAGISSPDQDDVPIIQVEGGDGELKTVDSLLVPIDRDCHCQLVGQVAGRREVVNIITGAGLWALGIETSELRLPVLVPGDLFSRPPLVDDRFQGIVWLQGQISEGNGR